MNITLTILWCGKYVEDLLVKGKTQGQQAEHNLENRLQWVIHL